MPKRITISPSTSALSKQRSVKYATSRDISASTRDTPRVELELKEFLRELGRQRKQGRSMASIARELCVSYQAVQQWLAGTTEPSRMVLRMAYRAGWCQAAGQWPMGDTVSDPT